MYFKSNDHLKYNALILYPFFFQKFFPAPNVGKSLELLGLDKNFLTNNDYSDRNSRRARARTNDNLKKCTSKSTKKQLKKCINDDSDETEVESSSQSESDESGSDDDFMISDKESEDEANQEKNENDDDESSTEVENNDDEDSDVYSSEMSDLSEDEDEDSDDFDDSDEEPWEKYGPNGRSSKKRSINKKVGKKNKKLEFGSKEAGKRCIELKNSLLEKLNTFADRLPPNTIDDLIEKLGGKDSVAELTGRKGRVVSYEGDVMYESRKEQDISLEKMNIVEKERFMNDEKNIAIISEAASSGMLYIALIFKRDGNF